MCSLPAEQVISVDDDRPPRLSRGDTPHNASLGTVGVNDVVVMIPHQGGDLIQGPNISQRGDRETQIGEEEESIGIFPAPRFPIRVILAGREVDLVAITGKTLD